MLLGVQREDLAAVGGNRSARPEERAAAPRSRAGGARPPRRPGGTGEAPGRARRRRRPPDARPAARSASKCWTRPPRGSSLWLPGPVGRRSSCVGLRGAIARTHRPSGDRAVGMPSPSRTDGLPSRARGGCRSRGISANRRLPAVAAEVDRNGDGQARQVPLRPAVRRDHERAEPGQGRDRAGSLRPRCRGGSGAGLPGSGAAPLRRAVEGHAADWPRSRSRPRARRATTRVRTALKTPRRGSSSRPRPGPRRPASRGRRRESGARRTRGARRRGRSAATRSSPGSGRGSCRSGTRASCGRHGGGRPPAHRRGTSRRPARPPGPRAGRRLPAAAGPACRARRRSPALRPEAQGQLAVPRHREEVRLGEGRLHRPVGVVAPHGVDARRRAVPDGAVDRRAPVRREPGGRRRSRGGT